MPRKRTGSKELRNGIWYIKLTVDLRGGGIDRRRIELPKGTTEEQAEAKRLSLAAKAAGRLFERHEPVETPRGDITFEAFVEEWLRSRIARGLRSVRKDRQRLRDHVTPVLKGKFMRDITSDDLRGVVEALDRKIRDEHVQFAWKTANKTWGAVTKLFTDAARSKELALRVLKTNPCADVEGPDRGHKKVAQWLYPVEFAALMSCGDVPLRWRRIYAVATYLYLRLGEERAIEWSDIDTVHWMVRIHRSADERGRGSREYTKTGSVRHFRIEPNLRPLLTQMAKESGAQGRLFNAIVEAPAELRKHLLRAGITRQALHSPTATSLPLRFHDLRATGITWAALRGDATIEIRDRAGHAEVEQTNEYMRRAAGAGDIGDPFPVLLLGDIVPGNVPRTFSHLDSAELPLEDQCEGGDLNPHESYPASTSS